MTCGCNHFNMDFYRALLKGSPIAALSYRRACLEAKNDIDKFLAEQGWMRQEVKPLHNSAN